MQPQSQVPKVRILTYLFGTQFNPQEEPSTKKENEAGDKGAGTLAPSAKP